MRIEAVANQGADENSAPVRRRIVIHCGGFELVAPELLDRRIESGMEKFAPLWGIAASRSAPSLSDDGAVMSWDVAARGPNWATTTRFATLRWDGLIEPYVQGALLPRLARGYVALSRFLLISGLARGLGWLPFAPITALILLAAVSVGLLYGVSHAIYLDFSLDHWAFAEALARRKVGGLEATLDRFAREIVAAVAAEDADEVIVSGTSLGAVIAVEAVARALDIDPALLGSGRRVALLTTGSSLLQVGLHPKADGLRGAIGRVAVEANLFWLEIQTTVDPVNFCNTDPVADLGIAGTGSPVVRVFRPRDLMSEEAYQRIRYDHVRLHRQYVMPNGKRHYYDFYMICFGPMPLAERTELADDTLAAFGEDGAYHVSCQ